MEGRRGLQIEDGGLIVAGMTQREYAAHRGVSQPAVSKAIKTGRIQLEADGRIDPVKADAAWKRNTDPEKQANGHTGGAKAPRRPPTRAPTEEARPEPRPAAIPPAMPPETDLAPKLDYNRARTVRETYAAKLAELEYKEKSGQLIKREAVHVGLFKVFVILKTHMLGVHSKCRLQSEIPPKVVDLIDTLCRAGLEEAHRALQEMADGKL